MECFLDPRRTRTAIKCVSFGAILLWILCGSYVRQELSADDPVHGGFPGRHLLYTAEQQELGVPSKAECEELLYGNGNPVNTEDDQVSIVGLFWSCVSFYGSGSYHLLFG